MVASKLVLENFEEEAFLLCAIHSSTSIFKIAFLLNKYLNLRLKRHPKDVKIEKKHGTEIYPCYVFDDLKNYNFYTLFKNKCFIQEQNRADITNNLFGYSNSELLKKNLIPEFKKVDYFFKIETDNKLFDIEQIISKIKLINNVITAFAIDYESIKTKNNLIIT